MARISHPIMRDVALVVADAWRDAERFYEHFAMMQQLGLLPAPGSHAGR